MRLSRAWSAAVLLSVVVVAASVAPAHAQTAPAATAAADPAPTGKGPLSPTLAALAGVATGRTASADANVLADSGPGSISRDEQGNLLVDVVLDDTSPATRAGLERSGARVTAVGTTAATMTLAVPASQLPAIAQVAGVRAVTEVLTPVTRAACPTGVVTEGDTQLAAASARSTFGVDGTGIKVGILSDSFNALGGRAADIAAAELPGVANPCGFPTPPDVLAENTGGDEGRAMAQIVHDLAPGATLLYATAFGGENIFANNIRNLAAAGATVIVDDVGYFAEPMYQDGVVAEAIRDVKAQGVSYFSAAGNANRIVGGKNVGSYEAPAYRPMSCPTAVATFYQPPAHPVLDCHDFNPAGGTDNTDGITIGAGGRLQMDVGWSEPMFGISTDIDAFLLDSSNNVVEYSGFDSPAAGRAFEFLDFTNPTGSSQTYRVVFARYSGSGTPRLKFILETAQGLSAVEYNTSSGGDVVGPTLYGHSGSQAAGSIGAIPFNSNSAPETFSSRGPMSTCWAPLDGTAVSSSLSPCQDRNPDLVATDGGINSFFGTGNRFYGTSAAAPHAAAIAALQLQARPCRGPNEVLAAQRALAVPVGAFAADAIGAGRVQAPGAITNLAACPATHYSVVAPSSATAGQAATVTVTALDATNRTVPTYAGTVAITSTDGAAGLPPNATLVNGVGTFSVTLNTLGTATATATDTVDGSINGTSGPIKVTNPIGYHPLTPVRILESRPQFNPLQYTTPWTSQADRKVHVTGNGVPTSATAVVLNVTAVGPTAGSDLRIYPDGATRPNTSNLNFVAGQTIPNLVMARVGNNGDIRIFNNAGQVDVVADLVGWYDDGTLGGDRYTALTPTRILESRPQFDPKQYTTPWSGQADRAVHVLGNGVPNDATAVILNVTAVGPTAGSDLRIYPNGQTRPNASNLNFRAGETIPNLVVAAVGDDGDIRIFNNAGQVDVVADVVGFFLPAAQGGDGYHPMTPNRILETRPQFNAMQYTTPWSGQADRIVHVTGGTVPANATAVVLNVTAVGPTAGSDLRVYPNGVTRPNASNLNFVAGKTIPNLVVVQVGSGGNIRIFNNAGQVDVLADVVGFFT